MIKCSELINWFYRLSGVYSENREYLTQLDAAIGDADHGINLDRGFTAVRTMLEQSSPAACECAGSVPLLLKNVSMTLIKTVGGASGPLYGTFFLKGSGAVGDAGEIDGKQLVEILEAGVEGIRMRGRAAEGEKTMLDALAPAVRAMKEEVHKNSSLDMVLLKGEEAAEKGMLATKEMKALKGRASYLGERSIGHIDPGAASAFLMIKAAREVFG